MLVTLAVTESSNFAYSILFLAKKIVLANSMDCTVYTLITLWLIKVMNILYHLHVRAHVHGTYRAKKQFELKSVGQFFLDSGEGGRLLLQTAELHTHLYIVSRGQTVLRPPVFY